jgi:hypothetical protein
VVVAVAVAVLMVAQSMMGAVSTNFLFRNRMPILNDATLCDLTPLFAWWAEQLQEQQNSRLPDRQKAGAVEGPVNTAERPMTPWLHVSGQIAEDNSQGWVVDATVETAPGEGKAMKIMVIHPPRKEMDRFDQRMKLLNNPPPQPDYSAQEAQIKAQTNRAFIANAVGADDLEDSYRASANRAKRELEVKKKRDQSVADERAGTMASLGDFPADWQTYRVDIFAFNTGRQLGGLPVFDAGLSFVK